MKHIPLAHTNEQATVDDELFDRINSMGRWLLLETKHNKYAVLSGSNRAVFMHNQIFIVDEGKEVDHIDGNGLNNQVANLRSASRSENSMNKGLNKNNTSGFKGVSFIERLDKWRAYIVKDKKQTTLGYFVSREEAARAYDKAAERIYGEFAKLNFPKGSI